MRRFFPTIGLILLIITARGAQAHPADMYFHSHRVEISAEQLKVTWEMVTGPIIAQSIFFDADQDHDELVSQAEALAWSEMVLPAFTARLDGAAFPLELVALDMPSDMNALFTGQEPLRITLAAVWQADLSGAHQLELSNRLSPKDSLHWYSVSSAHPLVFETPRQDRGSLSLRFGGAGAEGLTEEISEWQSGNLTVPWANVSPGSGEKDGQGGLPVARPGAVAILEDLITDEQRSPFFIISALGIAIILGALHALSPGHGKTIVAAYLVGSKGRFYHAAALGAIVTLTHTGSVFALGLVTLTASRYLLAADIFPVLELVSGLLILLLGIGLMVPRVRFWLAEGRRRERLAAQTPQVVREKDGTSELVINQPVEEIGPPHSHDPAQGGYIPRGVPGENPLAGVKWRSLVTLGISGGLVPCPDAIAILLIAVAINRLGFGLSLIAAFSLGLAIILIAIGLLILQGKRLFARLRWFNRAAAIMPVASALIVVAVGALLTVGAMNNLAQVAGGDETFAGIPRFKIEKARMVYLLGDEEYKNRLVSVPAVGGAPQALADSPWGIWEFAVSPDGSEVAYIIPDGDNGTQFWRVAIANGEKKLALDCANTLCTSIAWAPDGSGLLYSRQVYDDTSNTSGFPTIWWLDLSTGETSALFKDALIPGILPAFSPDGAWLSYNGIIPQSIQVYGVETGERQSLLTQSGFPVAWSPSSDTLLLVDAVEEGEDYVTHVFRYDMATQALKRLTTDGNMDEYNPAWSPDGEWIALVRQAREADGSQTDNQVWLVRPDGSEAHTVTAEVNVFHGQPAWSPDGRYLLYDLYLEGEDLPRSAIHLLDLESGETIQLASPGTRPAWVMDQ